MGGVRIYFCFASLELVQLLEIYAQAPHVFCFPCLCVVDSHGPRRYVFMLPIHATLLNLLVMVSINRRGGCLVLLCCQVEHKHPCFIIRISLFEQYVHKYN